MSQQQQQHATGMGYHRAAEDVPSFCSNGGGSDSDSTDYLYLEVGSLVRHLEDEDEDEEEEEEEEEETAETVRRRKQADADRIISQEASSDENDIREDKITVPENFALVKPPTARSNLLAQGLYSKLKPDRSSNHHSNHHHRHHHHHHQHHHHHHHHEPHPNHSDDHHHHHHHRHHRHHHHHHHSKHLHLVQQPQPSTVTIDAHQPSVLMNGDADEVAATTATHGDESHISKTSSVTQNCTNNHHHPSSSSSYEFEHLNHHNYYKIRKVENDSTTANIYTEKVTARIEPHQHQQHSKPIVINGVYHPQKSATAVDYQPKTDQTENAFSSEITNNTSGPIIVRNGLESEPLQPQLLTKPSSPLSLPSLPAFQKAEQHQTLNSQQQQQQQQQSPPSASPQQKPHSKPHRSKQRPSSKRRRSKRPFHRFSSHFRTALKGRHNKAEPLSAPSSSSLEAAPSESASASSSAATADTPFSPLSPDPRPLEAILYQLCLRGRLPRRTAAADAHLLRSHLLRSIAYCPLAEADSWGRRRRKRRQLLCAMCPRARYYDTRSYEHYLRHLVGHLNSRVYCSVCHAYVEGSGYYGLVHHLRGSSTSSSTGGSCCLERRMAEEEKEEADLQITAPKAMSEEGEEERRSRRRRQLLTELIEEAIDLGKNWPTLYCAFVYQGVHLDEQVFLRVSWCTTCRILTQQQLQQQQRQKELTENGQTADCQTNPIQNGANSVDQSSGSSSSSEDSLDSQLLLQQQQQQLEQGNLIESSSQQQMPDQNFDLSFDAFDTSNHREVVDLRTSPAAFFDHLVQHMFYFRYVCLPCAQRRALEFASPRSLSFQAYREVTVSFPAFNFVTREHIARFHADFSQLPGGRLFFQRFMLVGEIEAALEEHLTGTLFDLRAAEKELYRKEDVERILAEVHPVDPLRFEPRTKEVATQWPPVVSKAEEMARKKIRLAVEKKKNDRKMKMANDANDLAEQTPAIPVAKTVNGLSNGELLFGDDDSLTSSDTFSLSPSSIWQQYQEHLICTVQKATKTGIPIDELFEQEQPQTPKKLSTPQTLLSLKNCSRSAKTTPELATVVPPNSCDARLTNGEILETAEVEQNRNNGTSNGITHKRVILNSSLNGDNFSRHYSGDKTTAKLATQNANSVELELEKTNNVDLSQSDDHSENNRQQLLLQQRIENLANRLNDSKGVQL